MFAPYSLGGDTITNVPEPRVLYTFISVALTYSLQRYVTLFCTIRSVVVLM